MPILWWGDLPTLGAGAEAGTGHTSPEGAIYRYRCCQCQRTFRHYAEGITRADQTERLRLFAVICWRLGLSYRGVSMILSGLRVSLCPMMVWRDAQEQEQKLRRRNEWKPVRVLGLDGAFVLGWGDKRPVLVAVDMGEGQPVAVGYVNEHDPQAVRRWLEPIVQRPGVSVIVSDDLALYRTVAKQLNLEHQIGRMKLRARTVRGYKAWPGMQTGLMLAGTKSN